MGSTGKAAVVTGAGQIQQRHTGDDQRLSGRQQDDAGVVCRREVVGFQPALGPGAGGVND